MSLTKVTYSMIEGSPINVLDYGATGDGATNDTAAIQAAINALPANGGAIYFPVGTYLTDSLTGVTGLKFLGDGSGYYGGTVIKLKTSNTTLLTFTDKPQFEASNLLFEGTSGTVQKGEDVTDIGIYFNNATAGDIDANFQNVGFIYFQDCVKVVGRNVKFNSCTFSNSKRGVYIPTTQPADVRGLEMYSCRFHSMGKDGASNVACVYIDPVSNYQEVVIIGFDADDCLSFYYGFSSMTTIIGEINKARSTGITINTTGATSSNDKRIFNISTIYAQENPTVVAGSSVYSTGSAQVNLNGCVVMGCGGPGFNINTAVATLAGCVVHNAGQLTNNSAACFYVSGDASVISACAAFQDRTSVKTNKANYGYYLDGDYIFINGLFSDSLFATSSFYRNPAKVVQGQEPIAPLRHEAWGTVAPIAGKWTIGDVVWNTAPASGNPPGWVCTVSGTPGTWRAMANLA